MVTTKFWSELPAFNEWLESNLVRFLTHDFLDGPCVDYKVGSDQAIPAWLRAFFWICHTENFGILRISVIWIGRFWHPPDVSGTFLKFLLKIRLFYHFSVAVLDGFRPIFWTPLHKVSPLSSVVVMWMSFCLLEMSFSLSEMSFSLFDVLFFVNFDNFVMIYKQLMKISKCRVHAVWSIPDDFEV